MTFNKIFYGAIIAVMTASCSDDFLTKEDPNKIDQASFFRDENDLKIYSNGFIENMLPSATDVAMGDSKSDYTVWNGAWEYLTDNYDADDQGSWTWTQLRNINYFLNNIHRAKVSEEVAAHYEGVGRFWRAYFYWNKVKLFGAVPWYDKVIQDTDIDLLYKGRDSREFVMGKILEDIDFACKNCMTGASLETNAVQITKNVALALKSRICLYEGTFRKYHSVDPSTAKPWTTDESTKYLTECVKACEELMNSNKYKLLNKASDVATQYRTLFNSAKINTGETIWAHPYDAELMSTNSLTYEFSIHTVISVNKRFMNTYLNRDGSRFTDRPDYNKVEFINEFEGRDWRMTQSFRHPGFTRMDNGVKTPFAPLFSIAYTGYQPIKWTIDDTNFDNTKSPGYNSIPIIRYAEILLNYAEAKFELGQFSSEIWDKTIRPLRERSGVKGDMPASADPYMADYFLNRISDATLLEIRRERGIELLLEDVRWDDDMRWAMGELLTRSWEGLYVPQVGVPFDLDGDTKPDVCFVTKNPDKKDQIAGVQYRLLNKDFTLSEGTSGNFQIFHNLVRKWEDKKYVRPIPTKDLNENPALGQNPGWEM